jgi:hypothetical protein
VHYGQALDYIIYSTSFLPSSAMPASQICKSGNKKKSKEYAREITYVEKRARSGGVNFVAVDVPTSSTHSDPSASPSTSRQSTHAPASQLVDLNHADVSFDPSANLGPSTNTKKTRKVFECLSGIS